MSNQGQTLIQGPGFTVSFGPPRSDGANG